ncbi:bifunctional adenosylcobinamide kinase/adenosylcobinamide-phosphate guanylyltransferase [Alteribacillus sp. YIM 98480]|uniref:bifunctional adenosylcobinamide kinase/adenosylcobinamide-phosphate guanylyltransferase n=1 Tax=Alteribacillus sp. YIM 98480 TaxID=2606599 RepID=UPI00131CA3E2|nr:bifunctional adenosylcobinamide kinase/adenosylcobinamide-phosphate guanylyltransferase [Alteribacillus sp. YIM 98480]
MYFITGGAFNGKKRWVLTKYSYDVNDDCKWYHCYTEKNKYIMTLPYSKESTLVIEGIEKSLEEYLKNGHGTAKDFYDRYLLKLLTWEQQDEKRKLIIIGTDMTKGIVPIDKDVRHFRDELGRLYQKLVQMADDTIIVWFGLGQSLS